MKIYYPGINRSWKATKKIRLNAYLNLLTYAGADMNEDMIEIEMFTSIPAMDNGKVTALEIDGEKKLAYVNGLYHEDFYHEDENYKKTVLKKMKNRITSPVIFVNPGFLKVEENTAIPCVCSGYDEESDCLVIINPISGEYELFREEDCALFEGRKKMIMLNIPGMNKIHQIPNEVCINNSIELYRKQWTYYVDIGTEKLAGIKALKSIEESNEIDEKSILNFIAWIEKALKYESDLKQGNLKYLLKSRDIYKELLNSNIDIVRRYINEIEKYHWD